MTKTIELKNVGAVRHLDIPIPEGGGIVVLRGRNGSGKSTTLQAVEALTSGSGKGLTPRDGTAKGTVSGCGVTLSVARSTRRSGELEVVSLEGKLSVADLVDPGIQDPEAADRRRIRALVSLSAIDTQDALGLWASVLPEGLDLATLLDIADLDGQDVLEQAALVKRALERQAREREKLADEAAGQAKAYEDEAAAAGDEQPQPARDLQAKLEEAVQKAAQLREAARHGREAQKLARHARDRLAGLTADQTPLDAIAKEAQQANGDAVQADRNVQTIAAELDAVQRRYEAAIIDQNAARHRAQQVDARLKTAQERDAAAGELAEQISQWEAVPAVEQAQVDKAEFAITTARRAIERNALLLEARHKADRADEHQRRAAAYVHEAQRMREAAQATQTVLSRLVAREGCPLYVDEGRLMLLTCRGPTFFSDLSAGERWKLALDLAIDQLGERGLLVIPQEAFEGLDPIARQQIAEHVRSRGVCVVTAEASEDEQVTAGVL